jgi:Helicase associated domain
MAFLVLGSRRYDLTGIVTQSTMRGLKKKEKLQENRISLLESIGFRWSIPLTNKKLQLPPPNQPRHHNPNLPVANQTTMYPHNEPFLTWDQSFENLKVYKENNGHCDVPSKYKQYPKLGYWVVRIRQWLFLYSVHGDMI